MNRSELELRDEVEVSMGGERRRESGRHFVPEVSAGGGPAPAAAKGLFHHLRPRH